MGKSYVYVGNRRTEKQPLSGIAICGYEEESGKLQHLKNVYQTLGIGAVYLDTKRNVLYCTDELVDYPGLRAGGGGQVVAFALNPANGDLTEINRRPSYGAKPSSLVTDPAGHYLLVTNHGYRNTVTQTEQDAFGKLFLRVLRDESSVVLYPLREDGSIGEPCDIFRLSGEGPEPFQLSAHAHSIRRSPLGKLYAVCDKGGDQVFMFKLDYDRQKIVPCPGSPLQRSPGSAPRYSAFHPQLPYLFVNKENKPIISAFRYDEEGKLEHIWTVDALPPQITPPEGFLQSDICLGKSGHYLYSLLRVVNVISVFKIDGKTGRLTLVQALEKACAGGRGCAVSPDGRFLILAALEGHEVATYPIGEDGRLSPAVSSIVQPLPGTVTFWEA
ncbi:beta-propeller fold lactonase family protein [Desulfosporosinus sp. PR]|uniref:lactonase family protein n=1 Tax=Candidatus Desulfosporosinus nitrosoreducens TaxID=3401928 RepID=UPI0027F94B15|nr:beta-propeller fold lactonase family protein [Desulfosporosinus sp. PR]MDQ7096541.1 beta-propeller fold lactonase family protein [Desulfosporosinus sp. PR]